ncbi:mycothiol transferase [Streptomyces sp. SHP 1-2]|uniref:mycothiol transferase n=1 Tax=Streptomyces sp. SHP 1-2 TaxID=2769489 RepID=UPI0022376E10|nr:DinB family protein [Streptomyces sp. SHP 1-2]MCW5250249.1 DinB family protein [Streptomyces sp. SHP 1-2]
MHAKDILIEGYGRIAEEVHAVLDGLDTRTLNARPPGGANPVAWLLWHLARVQDDHVADAFGLGQLWHTRGWEERLGLGLPSGDTGYGHRPAQVAAVRFTSGKLLGGYFDAVHERTLGVLRSLTAKDLERIVDERWDPPVTLGVRLVSVLSDDLQHVGQAAYARGLLQSADA